jgi:hypothetical protein
MSDIETTTKIIARLTKNRRESVVVALDEYMGTPLVHVRQHYVDEAGQDRPTSKGICINVARLPELRAALQMAEKEAVRCGLIADEGGER